MKHKYLLTSRVLPLIAGSSLLYFSFAIIAALGDEGSASTDERSLGAESPKIQIVLLDQASIKWGRSANDWSWPWPREAYGLVADFCSRSTVRAVVWDVLFTEMSTYGSEDDLQFARALGRTSNSVLACSCENGVDTRVHAVDHEGASREAESVEEPIEMLRSIPQFVEGYPITELSANALLIGAYNIEAESDGICRRARPFFQVGERTIPSLGVAAFVAGTTDREHVRFAVRKGDVRIGQTRIPVDLDGKMALKFRGRSDAYKRVSMASVIRSELLLRSGKSKVEIDPQQFSNSYVFVAFSFPGMNDLRAFPVGEDIGVLFHITVLENLLKLSERIGATSREQSIRESGDSP